MTHPRFGITFGLIILALAAACASQAASPTNTRPALDLSATATPATLQLPEPTAEQNAQPGPTEATPGILPPTRSEIPEPGLVQGLSTNPYTVTLTDGGDFALAVRFYPAPQSESPALLLLSTLPQERAAWHLLAQTAQVKGLAAMLLELPADADGQQAVNAAIKWLANPANGRFDPILTAGSGSGAGLALAAFEQSTAIQAALVFSAEANDPLVLSGLAAAADHKILAVECSNQTGALQASDTIEVLATQCSQPGVEMLSAQPGLLNRVLDWCLAQLSYF